MFLERDKINENYSRVILRKITSPASSAIPTPSMYGNISFEKSISIEK